jgi:hypothetical protein
MLGAARRSRRSIALSAPTQSCIWSVGCCRAAGVPEASSRLELVWSSFVPELGVTISHVMTSSIVTTAIPPTSDATSWSSMRSSSESTSQVGP